MVEAGYINNIYLLVVEIMVKNTHDDLTNEA